MNIPDNLLYTSDHEWVLIKDNIAIIGITDYAQGELGDVIFIELPSVGDKVKEKDSVGTIEAVKTVADIFSPVDGTICEINSNLEDKPENMNTEPYSEGWIFKIKDFKLSDSLLKPDEYKNIIT
jgi:glycine cleavage system H protein